MKRSIQKVDKCLSMIENAVIILGLSAMFLILLAQVIRISYAYRQKGHIRMEVVVNLFPQAVRRGLEVLINLGTIALFCYMIPFSFRFIGIQAGVKATATHIPMSIVYTALPLGMALSCVRLLISSLRIVWGEEENA